MTGKLPYPIERLARRCERGVAAIEYSLIAALITLALVTSISGVGGASRTTWSKVDDEASSAMGCPAKVNGNGKGRDKGNAPCKGPSN